MLITKIAVATKSSRSSAGSFRVVLGMLGRVHGGGLSPGSGSSAWCVAARLYSNGVSHRRSGSTSMNRALTKRLAGTASRAPTPPRIVVQISRERKHRVPDSPTVVPTTRGCVEHLQDDVERGVDRHHGDGGLHVMVEQSDDRRGRLKPDQEPDVRDVVGDERQQSPQPGVADVEGPDRATTSHRATPAPKMVATARYCRLPRANSWSASARRRGRLATHRPGWR